MTILLLIIAMATVMIAFAVAFACGFYIGKHYRGQTKLKPAEPDQKQQREAERYARDLNAIMTYDGTPQA